MIVLTDEEWDAQYAELAQRFALLLARVPGTREQLSSELSAIVKEYPTSASTEALARAIVDTIHAKPAAIDFILPAVAAVLPEFEATEVDWAGSVATWSYLFRVDFLDLLNTVLFELQLHQKPRTAVEPGNLTLTCALLSGAMAKYGFIPDIIVPTRFALTCIQTQKGRRAQVRVVSVCLQLNTGGKKLVAVMEREGGYGVEKVVESLKRFRREEYLAGERGVGLLEGTIDNAERGFPRTYTCEEMWEKLFPP